MLPLYELTDDCHNLKKRNAQCYHYLFSQRNQICNRNAFSNLIESYLYVTRKQVCKLDGNCNQARLSLIDDITERVIFNFKSVVTRT